MRRRLCLSRRHLVRMRTNPGFVGCVGWVCCAVAPEYSFYSFSGIFDPVSLCRQPDTTMHRSGDGFTKSRRYFCENTVYQVPRLAMDRVARGTQPGIDVNAQG